MIHIDISRELLGSRGVMQLDINLKIEEGTFLAISGKSGSGKTTLLRILAGLERAKGHIGVGDEVWMSGGEVVPIQKRGIGFVFQDYALFENMSVEKNLLYVNGNRALAEKLLKMSDLSELKNRLPSSLSGGQKQRVALCRALMKRPKILLLDEPLSSLDPQMRTKLQNDILRLHREFGTTTIMVSHDPSEIYRLSNRTIILEYGKVVNDGNPKNVLLKTQGSQKFSFEGELLEIREVDLLYIAVVAVGQQIVEVVLDASEADGLKPTDIVSISAKAFAPSLKKVGESSEI